MAVGAHSLPLAPQWLGADETWWVYSSVGVDGSARTAKSGVFEGVDTGDSRTLGVSEGCIYVACSGGTAPIGP